MDETADRRLRRSTRDRRLLGVCGGLGDYFAVDPVLWRLAFLLLLSFGGVGLYAYLAMLLVMSPPQNRALRQAGGLAWPEYDLRQVALEAWPGLPASRTEVRSRRRRRLGTLLVLVGTFFLAINLNVLTWLRWDLVWPLLIIAVGAVLLVRQPMRL